ncbi:MAG: phage head-tail connector protein [Candidatus Thorarchaeota archaeon]
MEFITVSEVKTYLGITGSSEDTNLGTLVDSVNTFIPNYTNRTWDLTTYTEELYDGSGHAALILKNRPVVSISEILVNTEEVTERSDVNEIGWFVYDYDQGIVYNNNLWTRGRGNIQVSYIAGYEDADALPSDLKHACLELASFFRTMRGKSGIVSEALGSYSYSLMNNPASFGLLDIPDVTIRLILDKYKELGIPWDVF